MKKTIFSKRKICEKDGIALHFAYIFDDWFNKRQLDSLFCSHIHLVETHCLS